MDTLTTDEMRRELAEEFRIEPHRKFHDPRAFHAELERGLRQRGFSLSLGRWGFVLVLPGKQSGMAGVENDDIESALVRCAYDALFIPG